MITRRVLVASATSALVTPKLPLARTAETFASARPPTGSRAFVSPVIERTIGGLQRRLGSRGIRGKLAQMVGNCLPNTLDTTIEFSTRGGRPDTFVITGDIHAMWLRDSTAQLWPYLRFARADPQLKRLLRGAVERQTSCVLLDPYANAFNREAVPSPDHLDDDTQMKPGVFERKWELDSLCSVIRMARGYWQATGDVAPFDSRWREAMKLIVDTMRTQQRKNGPGPYRFQRRTAWNPDSAPGNGYGNPIRPIGLIVSLFRPSDDAAIFPFLVPANMYAVVELRELARLTATVLHDYSFAARCRALADEVERALRDHALIGEPGSKRFWAYEIDGYGNRLFMDDANVPSLLSVPYLGWCAPDDAYYLRTRALVLSNANPWFHRGSHANGIGSPHTPGNRIWPIAIAMRALTSTSESEIADCLRSLALSDGGTGFMHESFDPNDPAQFSRPWFAWANSLFGELMLTVASSRPSVFDLLEG